MKWTSLFIVVVASALPAAHATSLLAPRRASLLALRGGAADKKKPAPQPIAKTPFDVVRTTLSSFVTVSGIGFAFTAAQESSARAGVSGMARKAVPGFVIRAALLQGQRWGRVSAGFAGGRAAGQLWCGEDGFAPAMWGAVAGGVAAAPNVAGVPSSVATFVAFSYFIEKLSNKQEDAAPVPAAAARGNAKLAPRKSSARSSAAAPPALDYGKRPEGAGLTPGQRLDKMLGIAV